MSAVGLSFPLPRHPWVIGIPTCHICVVLMFSLNLCVSLKLFEVIPVRSPLDLFAFGTKEVRTISSEPPSVCQTSPFVSAKSSHPLTSFLTPVVAFV